MSADLARREGESIPEHLARIAGMHQLPGQGRDGPDTSAPPIGVDTLPAEERAALEAIATVRRVEALRRLKQRGVK